MTSPYASASTSTFNLSGDSLLDPLLNDSYRKWGGALGTGAELTFSFPWIDGNDAVWQQDYSSSNEPTATYHFGFNATQMTAARQAFQAWADVADLRFTEVSETATDVGDFRFAFTSVIPSETWGWNVYPSNYWANSGDTWVNDDYGSDVDWSAGTYNYEALMHEIGHGLGLKHPFEGSYRLPTNQDNRQYSIMSYTAAPYSQYVQYTTESDGSYVRSIVPVNSWTPMLYDIAVIQHLYGANLDYQTGNDVYNFDSATPFYRTIWDAGGTDTLSVVNFAYGCILDLQPGHYSKITIQSEAPQGVEWDAPLPANVYDGTDNLAIAFGCDIENAIGGSGGDTLIGNALANSLSGGSGSDTLSGNSGVDTLLGGSGDDVAAYSGASTDYVVSYDAASARYTVMDTTAGRDGTDSVAGIEWLQFSDTTLAPTALAQNAPTYALASDVSAIDEGGSVTYTLTTGNVAVGTVLNYTLSGVAAADVDGAALTGSVTVGADGSAVFTVTLLADGSTEGQETLVATLGGVVSAGGVLIRDTSTAAVDTVDTTADADDYPWSTDTSGVVVVGGGATSGVIGSGGDQDLLLVTLTAGATYVFDLARTSGGLSDPYLSLFDPSLMQVAQDDDGGGSLNARITYSAAVGGTFYLGVYDAGSGNGAYTITAMATTGQSGPISGGSGPDTLYGTATADDMNGGAGGDTLWGGDGNDTLRGGADSDDGADLLYGESGQDVLYGSGGADTLDGGAGADTLVGGAGNDVYYVGADAVDAIQDQGPASDQDAVLMPAQLSKYTLPNSLENGVIAAGSQAGKLTGNAGNNTLVGNDGKNTLSGMGGRDILSGGAGADTLVGGGGTDNLSGGKGADVFDFNGPGEIGVNNARDVITDFNAGDGDKIDVVGVDANNTAAGNQAFSFIGSKGFSAPGQLRFDAAAHVLHGNTDYDNAPEFSIQLSGVSSLSAAGVVL